ncbi:MAG: ATP-binding cassette domain-containing protein [Microscillaceae bacterium]|nr:ATP-binding cassette domain-containing protein [Microscillaceae bacterium]
MQQIRLSALIPEPLAEILAAHPSSEPHSQIWESEACFEKGRHYLVYAPSGKGKSTFIHILYGLRHDYTGTVQLDRQTIPQIRARQWADIRQQAFSIVFQDLRLFPELTARQNLRAKAVLYAKNMENEISQMAETLGIAHRLDKPAATLSYGERQRVAIIRALLSPFDFLLLDEPFSHLDTANIEKASMLIQEACARREAGLLMTSLGQDYGFPFDQKLLL